MKFPIHELKNLITKTMSKTPITRIALVIMVIMSAVACKKEKTPQPTCRIANMVIEDDTLDFNYNAANKLSQIALYVPDLGNRNHNFAYDGNLLTYNYSMRDPEIHTLNNDGTLKSMVRNYTISGSPYMDVMNFEYNNNKQLKAVYHTISNSSVATVLNAKDTLIYSNGNLIERFTYIKLASTSSYSTTPNEAISYTYGSQLNTYGLYTTKNLFFTNDQYIVPYYDGVFPYITHLLGNGSTNLCTYAVFVDNGRGITEEIRFLYTNSNENTMDIRTESLFIGGGGGSGHSEMSIIKSCN